MCIGEGEHVRATAHVWDQSVEVGSCPFYPMGLRDGTQVVRPGGKQPYPLSHLSGHSNTHFKECGNGWLILKADRLYLRFTLRPTDRQRQKQQTKVMGGGNERRNMVLPVGDSRLLQLDHSFLCHRYPTVESVYSPVRGSAKPELRGLLIILY